MLGKLLFLTVLASTHAGVTRSVFTKPHPDCPPNGHHLLPHEYDCTKFYYCEYGEKWITPRDCALGTEFNAEIQVCVHPESANCNLPGYPPTDAPEVTVTSVPIVTQATEEPSTTEAVVTTEEPATAATVTSVPIGTVTTAAPTTQASVTAVPIGTVTATSPTTEASVTAVPIGTVTATSPTTEASVTAVPVGTVTATSPTTEASVTAVPIGTVTATSPTTEASVTAVPIGTVTASSPTTEVTVTSVPIITPTTEESVATSAPTTASPTTTEASVELLPNGCPVDRDIHQLLPHETECDKFYYCVDGEKVLRECAGGTFFNPAIQVCDWPQNVECANSATTPGSPGSEDDSVEGSGEDPDDITLPNGCPADFDVHLLLPHANDCSKFYYCVHGNKVERDCPPGLFFNIDIQVCDVRSNVECSNLGSGGESQESSGSESTEVTTPETDVILPNGCPADFDVHQLLPHEKECSKFYYCLHGELVERDCRDGLHFNPAVQACDWPSNAGCTNSATDSSEEQGNPGTEENSGEESSGDGEDAQTTTSAPVTDAVLPNGCPADSNVHQLLPHESECDKFYSCVHGNKVEQQCAPGLHFNANLQVCDWTSNAGCTNAGTDSSEENSGDGEDVPTTTSAPVTDAVLPNGCPADSNVHQLLPHESECDKFYSCVHGNKVEQECPPGLHFNGEIQVCDWPSYAGCATAGTDSSEENSGDGEDVPTTTSAPVTDAVLPNGCPADSNVHQLLPHESECDKFYSCVHGNKVEQQCAPGLHFNADIQVCDWPSTAGCASAETDSSEENSGNGDVQTTTGAPGDSEESSGDGGDVQTTTSAPGDSEESSGNGGDVQTTTSAPGDSEESSGDGGDVQTTTSAPGDSEESSGNGGDVQTTTSAPGDSEESSGDGGDVQTTTNAPGDSEESSAEGSGSNETTTSAPDNEAVLPNGCPADPNVHYLLPHDTDCAKFYYCVHGGLVERECPPGLDFNAVLQVCDYPEDAGCTANGNQTDSSSGEQDGPSVVNPEIPNSDRCQQCNVLPWAHETDCDKYWICNGSYPTLITCAQGLHFSESLKTCDFKCNAGCTKNSVQTVVENDGLTVFFPWSKVDGELQNIIKRKTA